jgi:glutathione S-transferase
MIHRDPPLNSSLDPAYAVPWKAMAKRLGLQWQENIMNGRESTMLKLLGKASSINVRKVLWLAEELGLEVAHEEWGSGFRSTQAPEFLALNPNATVPVIRDGEHVLWESNAICRYLAGREQRVDLLPAAPVARSLIEQWMDWQTTELNNSWRYAFMALVRLSPTHTDAKMLATSVGEWHRHMQLLDRQLAKTKAYACGPDFTLADIVLGLSTNRWFTTPMERPELTAVAAYFDRLSQRPAFLRHDRNGLP